MRFLSPTQTGAFVDIRNWTGLAGETDPGATGNDHLLLARIQGLTNAQLANIAFYNDSNVAFAIGTVIAYGNELVPVPEPSPWVAEALALLSIGYTQRWKLVPALKRFSASK